MKATLIDGTEITVTEVMGYSKSYDLAVLKVDYVGTPLKKNTHGITMGEATYAIGSSLGMINTYSNGIVSNTERIIDGVRYIQTNAAISHGNSGGPLLNEYGEVMGVTSATYVDGQNMNLAIKISQLDYVNLSNPRTVKDFIYYH